MHGHCARMIIITARRSYATAVLGVVILSVCPSVCHTRALRLIQRTYRRYFIPHFVTANMQSKTGFPSSHQLKSYVAPKSRLKLSARCPASGCWPSCLKVSSNSLIQTCSLFDSEKVHFISVSVHGPIHFCLCVNSC